MRNGTVRDSSTQIIEPVCEIFNKKRVKVRVSYLTEPFLISSHKRTFEKDANDGFVFMSRLD